MGIVPKFNKNMRKMRKTRLSRATLVAATLVVAGYGGMKAYDYSYGRNVNSKDNLLMQNIEALGRGEELPHIPCNPSIKDVCVYKATIANGDTVISQIPRMVKAE